MFLTVYMSGFILFLKEFIHVYCLSTLRASLRSLDIILFFNMGQVKRSMDKHPITIYLSLGKYVPGQV